MSESERKRARLHVGLSIGIRSPAEHLPGDGEGEASVQRGGTRSFASARSFRREQNKKSSREHLPPSLSH
eukprot:618429-Amphidinium_carterae.1